MIEPDRVSIDCYAEAALAMHIGYSLYCYVAGIPTALTVRDVRLSTVPDLGDFEVRVLEGWRFASSCWAIGDGGLAKGDADQPQQRGLFG